MKISKDEINHLAWLARIEVNNLDLYEEQINKIIDYLNILDQVDIKDEPRYIVKELESFREDIPKRYDDISNMLNNKKDRYVKAPKMM